MKINSNGLELIKKFEGCSLKAYKLEGESYYTIGYGHSFDNNINGNTVWTQTQAEKVLIDDLQKYCNYVDEIAVVKFKSLNENQCNALMSYCYNRGAGGLRQLVNYSNTIEEMGNNLIIYWGTAVRYKNGLIKRRKAERELFFKAEQINPIIEEDNELSDAVSKIIKSGIILNYDQWKRVDLINLKNVPILLNRLGGLEKLIQEKVISDANLWDKGQYDMTHVRSLLLKYATIMCK